MTPDEISSCKEIAREIIKEVIKEHQDKCPHAQTGQIERMKIVQMYALDKARLFGIVLGVALGSSIGGGSIVGLIMHYF